MLIPALPRRSSLRTQRRPGNVGGRNSATTVSWPYRITPWPIGRCPSPLAQAKRKKSKPLARPCSMACLPEGMSIGDAESLAEPASPISFGSDEVRRHRPRPVGQHDVVAAEQPDPINPVRSAPAVRIGHTVLIGAQPAALLAQALHTAAALPTSPH